MNKLLRILFPVALLLCAVCGATAQNSSAASPTDLNIHIRDYCDPKTFNAVVGPGTCERASSTLNPLSNGAITFQGFVTEVTLDKSVGAWRFVPSQVKVGDETKLHLQNLGGETHTFTEVTAFGGGFLPFLNGVGGPTGTVPLVPAPACLAPTATTTVGPGGTIVINQLSPGVHKFQCCIHPWMRAVVDVE